MNNKNIIKIRKATDLPIRFPISFAALTLPASPSAGDEVAVLDYAGTFATYNLTIGRNGSNIQGAATNSEISTTRASFVLVYVDGTKGWLYTNESNVANLGPSYVAATGGTESTSGDFKIHVFNSTSNFVVSGVASTAANNEVSYLVAAGGGGGGQAAGGGAARAAARRVHRARRGGG